MVDLGEGVGTVEMEVLEGLLEGVVMVVMLVLVVSV